MVLQPKKLKYQKSFRGKMRGNVSRGFSLEFGDYGLKSLGCCWLTGAQIEAARRAATHYTKRQGRVWIRVFPDKPITGKTGGVTMGSGKGDVIGYVAVVRPGKVLMEIGGIERREAEEALRRAAQKLPIKTKIISKENL